MIERDLRRAAKNENLGVWVYGKCEIGIWVFFRGASFFYMGTVFLRNSIDFLNLVHSRELKLYGAIDFFIEKHI